MLILRVCSLLGTGLALFLRSKIKHHHQNPPMPPAQVETLGPDVSLEGPKLKPTDFEAVKSFYEDIRVIEEDNFMNQQEFAPVLNAAFEQGLQEAETFVQAVEEDDKSVTEKLSPEEEPIKIACESNEDNSSEKVEAQAPEEKEDPIVVVETVEAAAESITKEEITFPIIEKIEKPFSMEPMFGVKTEDTKLDVTPSQTTPTTKDSISSTPQESTGIISEDFWKNQEVYKSIENIQKEDKKPETKKEFELPSVLQNLRSSSAPANKPWLMKKKKTVEVPVETPMQAQTQTPQPEALEKVPEVQETPEVKAEKVTETPDVTPEVKVEPELMANLEGTTV